MSALSQAAIRRSQIKRDRLLVEQPLAFVERFWKFVEKGDDCWLWTGGRDKDGYGIFSIGYTCNRAHRIAFILSGGSIPDGMVMDHLCRNHSCVRPDHLRVVTNHENVLSGNSAPKTHCIRGHEFTPENTSIRTRRGWQYQSCRTCHRERMRRFKQKVVE